VELLVALAIFGILMSAVVIIFVGSLRTTQTGYQQMDAFERARTALSVIDDDLVRGYASHQSGDVHSFYGTPIGMTFVGVVQMTSNSNDINLARITYVVYNQPTAEGFPEAREVCILDSNGNTVANPCTTVLRDAYPYPLLRFVEPGFSDLESFPIVWESTYNGVTPGTVLQTLCDQAADSAQLPRFNWMDPTLGLVEQDIVRAKKCEIWIRILAGGDRLLPVDFWTNVLPGGVDYHDYIVTENILSIVKPYDRARLPSDIVQACDSRYDPASNPYDRGDDAFGEQLFCFDATRQSFVRPDPFFDYSVTGYAENAAPSLLGSPWWNDPRAWNWREPRLPEVVIAKFWLMFPSPYPGAPDFQRQFTLEVNLPVGYTRKPEL
jgi:hypothetical protein